MKSKVNVSTSLSRFNSPLHLSPMSYSPIYLQGTLLRILHFLNSNLKNLVLRIILSTALAGNSPVQSIVKDLTTLLSSAEDKIIDRMTKFVREKN